MSTLCITQKLYDRFNNDQKVVKVINTYGYKNREEYFNKIISFLNTEYTFLNIDDLQIMDEDEANYYSMYNGYVIGSFDDYDEVLVSFSDPVSKEGNTIISQQVMPMLQKKICDDFEFLYKKNIKKIFLLTSHKSSNLDDSSGNIIKDQNKSTLQLVVKCLNTLGFDVHDFIPIENLDIKSSFNTIKELIDNIETLQQKNSANLQYKQIKLVENKVIGSFADIPKGEDEKYFAIRYLTAIVLNDNNIYDVEQAYNISNKSKMMEMLYNFSKYVQNNNKIKKTNYYSNNFEISSFEIREEIEYKTEQPLNQILYGPPGTGKTYNTIIKAMEIIDNTEYKNVDEDKYIELRNRFNKLKQEKQIEFVTFHQSYSYEEFIEGIKPIINKENDSVDNTNDTKEEKNNDIKYEIKPGILKRICDDAKQIQSTQKNEKIDFTKTRIFKMSLGNAKTESDIFDYCIENNCISLGWGKGINCSDCSSEQDINNKIEKGNWGRTALKIFKLWIRKDDIILISNGNRNIRAIAKVEDDYEFKENTKISDIYGYNHYRKVKWLYNGEDIPITKIYEKNLSQQSIYAFYFNENENKENYNGKINTNFINDLITGDINNKKEENYVLIIDEINRGNISKIFGELITLIEEDKRIGNPHELKLTLPYSQEPFGIPKNLYIIGTMNTSDRSIASVDIALRRRFKFIEMMPNSNLVVEKINEINFQKIFKALNEKITILLDRDHQIGHSYFMNNKIKTIDNLKDVWFDEILPLLNEYFYNDWEKLQALLGEASDKNDSFIVTKKTNLPFYNYDIENKIYDFAKKEDMNKEHFKSALLKIVEVPNKKEDNKETTETNK